MNSIFHRTSIRKFTAEPVESEKLEQILRAAMAAPSACNQQPWEFYVVTDRDVIAQLSQATPYSRPCAGAPMVIVPCYRSLGVAPAFFQIDMSAAVENLLLEADAQDLGAVWMGIAPMEDRMEQVGRMIGIREDLHVFCLIAVGHPAETRQQQDRYDEARVHYI